MSMLDFPSAIDPIITARCDIDLSPGSEIVPFKDLAGLINTRKYYRKCETNASLLDTKPFETLTFTSDLMCLK